MAETTGLVLTKYQRYRRRWPEKCKAAVARWRATPEGHRAHLEAMRRYRQTVKGQAVHLRYRTKHPERWAAGQAIRKAIFSGELERPSRCQACRASTFIEAHHWKGYAKEHHFDVLWLCKLCHKAAER
jgi:hypothetical protein